MSLYMILIMFSFTFDLSSLMPRYLSYAAQSGPAKHMSKIFQFNTTILIKNSIFSNITFMMSNLFIIFYCIFFFYHMLHNRDSQFIINSCCCAEEDEYSDDDIDNTKDEENSNKGKEMDEIRKANNLDYAVLFEQEAMSIN
mmetsp:Transcript_11996/g.10594  ORF Transcript_11996/g.10594 Transcript_11996/m.10594 type:complete len:141 (-) Transcript_11996:23-445(-)